MTRPCVPVTIPRLTVPATTQQIAWVSTTESLTIRAHSLPVLTSAVSTTKGRNDCEAMKVKDLIEELSKMPPGAEVLHLWDGAPRTTIEHVWLSRGGEVITADHGQVCYYDECRPEGSPTESENRYWESPRQPSKKNHET